MTKNQIIEDLFKGKNFNDCLNKMEPEHLREDLRQEVILIICELPEEKIIKMYTDSVLEYFTARVIVNQIKSKTSPFAKKYRNVNLELNNYEVADNVEIEERELREVIEDLAMIEVDKLHWYDKGLIELYMKYGNYRAIEEVTRIPFSSCFKTIKKSLKEVKDKVDKPVLLRQNELNKLALTNLKNYLLNQDGDKEKT